jgi:hypothetical protein
VKRRVTCVRNENGPAMAPTKYKVPWFEITDGLAEVDDIGSVVLESVKGR